MPSTRSARKAIPAKTPAKRKKQDQPGSKRRRQKRNSPDPVDVTSGSDNDDDVNGKATSSAPVAKEVASNLGQLRPISLGEQVDKDAATERRRLRQRVRSILNQPSRQDVNRPSPGTAGYVSSDIEEDVFTPAQLTFNDHRSASGDAKWDRRQAIKEANKRAEKKAEKVDSTLGEGGPLDDTIFLWDSSNLRLTGQGSDNYRPCVDLVLLQTVDTSRHAPADSHVTKAAFARMVHSYMIEHHESNYLERVKSDALHMAPQGGDESVLVYKRRGRRCLDAIVNLYSLADVSKRELNTLTNDFVTAWIKNLRKECSDGVRLGVKFDVSKSLDKTMTFDEVSILALAQERSSNLSNTRGKTTTRNGPGSSMTMAPANAVMASPITAQDLFTTFKRQMAETASNSADQLAALTQAIGCLNATITAPTAAPANAGVPRSPICFKCRNNGLDHNHDHRMCPNGRGPQLGLPPPMPVMGLPPPRQDTNALPQCNRCTRDGKDANHPYKLCPLFPGCGACGLKGHYVYECPNRCPDCGTQGQPGVQIELRHVPSCPRAQWRPPRRALRRS